MTSKSKETKKFNVFLCLPMSGRTEEDILKEIDEMKKASIHYFQEKHPDCDIVYYANYRSDAEEESDNPVYLYNVFLTPFFSVKPSAEKISELAGNTEKLASYIRVKH